MKRVEFTNTVLRDGHQSLAATRMRTEVLSTTVFLELSVGRLEAAIAVSLLMVVVAVIALLLMRAFGLRGGSV